MNKRKIAFLTALVGLIYISHGEGAFSNSRISGSLQFDAHSYQKDSLIEAPNVDEKVLSNGYLWLTYSSSNFRAGLRYESYLNPMLGIDKRYKGNGIAHRFAEYYSDLIDVTAGNFYEQFGSGMIFRTYEERALGLDNSIDGMRVKFRPTDGIELTGLIGNQRKFWSKSDGIVRGGDAQFDLTTIFENLLPYEYYISLGASVVSRYQADESSKYNLPPNALAWASRLSFAGSSFSIDAEYGYKNPDPSASNDFNFNPGEALLLSASYYASGIGITANFHKNDNMDFRSDRNELGNVAQLNYLPPLTKQQTFSLPNIYPYATQLNGEIGVQAEITYTIPEKTLLGGKYGTNLSANFSQVNSIAKNVTEIDSASGRVFKYDSPMFEFGDRLYYRDVILEITRKLSDKLKSTLLYQNFTYDKDQLEIGGAGKYGKIRADVFAADLTYEFSPKVALRLELQHMATEQDSVQREPDNDNNDWFGVLGELTISPHWYFSVGDEYNYNNKFEERRLHYITASATYIHKATRVSLGWRRNNSGITCVGGVCRQVPAANGFFANISTSF